MKSNPEITDCIEERCKKEFDTHYLRIENQSLDKIAESLCEIVGALEGGEWSCIIVPDEVTVG